MNEKQLEQFLNEVEKLLALYEEWDEIEGEKEEKEIIENLRKILNE